MATDNGAAPDMVAIRLEEWERVSETLAQLTDDNRSLKWVLAILLARAGNEVVITSKELVEAESDDILSMEQNLDKSWTIRRESALDTEGSPE